MKTPLLSLVILFLLGLVGCQPATPTMDAVSIQNTTVAMGNTAVAMAWMSVTQTANASITTPTAVKATAPTTKPPTAKPSSGEVLVGAWTNDNVSICQNLKIYKVNNSYKLKTACGDGSSQTVVLTVKVVGGESRLYEDVNNVFGDYMVIQSGGYLAFYDNQGFIYRLPPK